MVAGNKCNNKIRENGKGLNSTISISCGFVVHLVALHVVQEVCNTSKQVDFGPKGSSYNADNSQTHSNVNRHYENNKHGKANCPTI